MNDEIKAIAKKIKLLILDVDGVLTNGTISYTSEGHEIKSFHAHDGLGIKRLMDAGIDVAIITSRESSIVQKRMDELGVKHVYQNARPKITAFNDLMAKLSVSEDEIAYAGDDLPDIPVMKLVALKIAVANAVDEVKEVANWETQKTGGNGAVREISDFIFSAKSA